MNFVRSKHAQKQLARMSLIETRVKVWEYTRNARASSLFLSSYGNTVLNQSARVFALICFLISYTRPLSPLRLGTRFDIGMSEHSFETRHNKHKLSFKHRKNLLGTSLSKYIWDLKASDTDFLIK